MSVRCTASLLFRGLFLALPLTLLIGCSGGQSRIEPPKIDATAAGTQAMEEFDANHDGAIAGAELDNAPGLKSALKKIDSGGRVTAEAITERIKSWGTLALAQISVKATMDGKPLADAEVKFIPEKFLGPNVSPGQGKTDANGWTMITGPPIERGAVTYRGMSCGFYRIEVTKQEGSKQIVPDRYNVHTIFGAEVARDSEDLKKPVELKMTSK